MLTTHNNNINSSPSINKELEKISNSFFIDLEDITNLQVTSLESSYLFSVLGNLLGIDETYENFKTLLFLSNITQNIQINTTRAFSSSLPSTSVFNSFRPYFDDFS